MRPLLLLFFILFSTHAFGQDHLFPVMKNSRIGYINVHGKMIIPAIYRSGGEFSEGLAPVRENGLYGYINTKGSYVIQPQYDYALPFEKGLAIVYKNDRPAFIKPDGSIPFQVNYSEVEPFKNGLSKVKTASGKLGFINLNGQLVVDTAFSMISDFTNGLAIVHGTEHNTEINGKRKYEVGVLNNSGRLVVPYGNYGDIGDYKNGYAKVSVSSATESGEAVYKTGFIDAKGEVIFTWDKRNSNLSGEFSDGLIPVTFYYHLPGEDSTVWNSSQSYIGYVDLKGSIVFSDTKLRNGTDFSEGRAFVGKYGENFILIDQKGNRVGTESFQLISDNGFKNGYAVVRKDYHYGIINRDGKFMVQPVYDEIIEPLLPGNNFIFQKDDLFGMAGIDGKQKVKPVFESYDQNGFVNGLWKGYAKDHLIYVDTSGNIVWKKKNNEPDAIGPLNIDFMNRGYFYAQLSIKEESGGWAESPNRAQPASVPGASKSFFIKIDTTAENVFQNFYKGYNVYVVNNSGKKIIFNAQDSRLNMVLQALDQNGVWRDIEYLPSSWCGNSYHTLELKSKEQWSFTMPLYEGVFATKIRAALSYIDPDDKTTEMYNRKQLTIYSNEINGSVNPGQFWRKPGYNRQGLMDPYND